MGDDREMRQGTKDSELRTGGQGTLFPWPLLKAISFEHAHTAASSLFARCAAIRKICLWEQRLICAAAVALPCPLSPILFMLRFWPACPLIKLNFMGHMYTLNGIG